MRLLFRLLVFTSLVCSGQGAEAVSGPIDFEKARGLLERRNGGATLSPEEQAYVAAAVAARKAGAGGRGMPAAGQRKAPETLTPLVDLAGAASYEGEAGGLYGDGQNTPPESHRRAALVQLAQIRPLDAAGHPAADGIIGFVSLSMSNATQEFSRFKEIADASPLKSPRVVIVDCAQGGQAMAQWVAADAPPWAEAKRRLAAARVTENQVQVAWVKLANVRPTGSMREHVAALERDTLAVLQQAKRVFPNLRIVYLGSRTYGGYAAGPLNPEPYAFEGAFAVRGLIARQVRGAAEFAVPQTPLLLWGPYLWADGMRGRKTDGLQWARSDFVEDGVHPSKSGRQKVAELLLAFFSTDPLAETWFARR